MAAHSSVWVLAGLLPVVLAACDPVGIEADVGEDVLLPCIVKRGDTISLSNPTVNWQVNWLNGSCEVVNSYYYGQNHPEYQCGQYKGRTEFSSQGLSDGNASLLLKNVTPADFGNYTCHASLYENTPQTLQIVLLMQKKTQGATVQTDAYVPGGHEKRLRVRRVCVLLSALVILVVGSFAGWCWCKKKTTKAKEGDEEAAQAREEVTCPRNSEILQGTFLHSTG
nr:butyrophilin subfamily 3 member A2-like [Caretta caretta]